MLRTPREMPADCSALGPVVRQPAESGAGGAGPAALYRQRSDARIIRVDPAQQRAIAQLQHLHETLSRYRPHSRRRLLARLKLGEHKTAAPKGLYLWGPVGRGKSMLMDLFFGAAPVVRKRRVRSEERRVGKECRL